MSPPPTQGNCTDAQTPGGRRSEGGSCTDPKVNPPQPPKEDGRKQNTLSKICRQSDIRPPAKAMHTTCWLKLPLGQHLGMKSVGAVPTQAQQDHNFVFLSFGRTNHQLNKHRKCYKHRA